MILSKKEEREIREFFKDFSEDIEFHDVNYVGVSVRLDFKDGKYDSKLARAFIKREMELFDKNPKLAGSLDIHYTP